MEQYLLTPFEVMADGEVVEKCEDMEEAMKYIDDTRLSLHRDKMLQVFDLWDNKIVHEEHPTVLED